MTEHVEGCSCEVNKSEHISYTGERHLASQQRVKPLCGVALPPGTPGRVPQHFVTDVLPLTKESLVILRHKDYTELLQKVTET